MVIYSQKEIKTLKLIKIINVSSLVYCFVYFNEKYLSIFFVVSVQSITNSAFIPAKWIKHLPLKENEKITKITAYKSLKIWRRYKQFDIQRMF